MGDPTVRLRTHLIAFAIGVIWAIAAKLLFDAPMTLTLGAWCLGYGLSGAVIAWRNR